MLYIHTVLSLYKMGRKKENILTREPIRTFRNQFGHSAPRIHSFSFYLTNFLGCKEYIFNVFLVLDFI
jgi:hypothetical protein